MGRAVTATEWRAPTTRGAVSGEHVEPRLPVVECHRRRARTSFAADHRPSHRRDLHRRSLRCCDRARTGSLTHSAVGASALTTRRAVPSRFRQSGGRDGRSEPRGERLRRDRRGGGAPRRAGGARRCGLASGEHALGSGGAGVHDTRLRRDLGGAPDPERSEFRQHRQCGLGDAHHASLTHLRSAVAARRDGDQPVLTVRGAHRRRSSALPGGRAWLGRSSDRWLRFAHPHQYHLRLRRLRGVARRIGADFTR